MPEGKQERVSEPPQTRKEPTMAHELDSTNGIVAFANSRTDAWHQLGQSVNHVMTASEALAAATLNGWQVRKMKLQIPLEPVITDDGVSTPEPIAVPDQFATVRTNPITGAIAPAALSAASGALRSWPMVLTRAYPRIAVTP
jgi:hypothetical protein